MTHLHFAEWDAVSEPHEAASKTALKCGLWELRRGKETLEFWNENGADTNGIDEFDAADCHQALFDPDPQLAENPESQVKAKWFEQLLQTPEYEGLHRETTLQTDMAKIAAHCIAEQWAEYKKRNSDQPGDGEGDGEEPIEKEIERIQSTGAAIRQAKESVDELKSIGAGLGMGNDGQIDWQEVSRLWQDIRNNRRLSEIMDMAGRMRNLARSLQQRKVIHGRDDMVGVELSGDLSRLIPAELMQLTCGVEELELLAMSRLAQRQCLSWQFRGLETANRGPIVVCVDESGSMEFGRRIIMAKSLALTMAWIANQQRRWFALVGFSGEPQNENDLNVLVGRHGEANPNAVMEWVKHFFGGGTDWTGPLDWVPQVFWKQFLESGMPRGKTDMILITDGEFLEQEQVIQRYKRWAEHEQVTTYGIVIGSRPGEAKKVCDRLWTVQNLEMDGDCVSELLSI